MALSYVGVTVASVRLLELLALGVALALFLNVAALAELVISEQTVKTHVSSILAKLHLALRPQAAIYAVQRGLAGD